MLTGARILNATAVAACIAFAGGPASAPARTTCVYEAAPTNVLTVTVSGANQAVITRSAEQIVVSENDGPPKPCTGGVPTVTNTDTIKVLIPGSDGPLVDVLLANGPLARARPQSALALRRSRSTSGGRAARRR